MNPSILVASDGSPASLGALRFALELERERTARVELFGVVEAVPVFDAGFLLAIPDRDLYEGRQEILQEELRSQLEELGRERDHLPVRVEAGLPGPRIVKRAEEIGASLIVTGLGRHRPIDRIFGTETALQVIHLSHIPVLAVPEDATTLPTCGVLGVDFSHFSHRASQAALSVMKAPMELHLVHVVSGLEFLPTMSQMWRADYEEELRERLSDLAQELSVTQGSKIGIHLLEGDPGHELLAFSDDHSADLIVAGSHGLSFVGRLLKGSVSTGLVRNARVPVLVVPPQDLTKEVFDGSAPPASKHPWVTAMVAFSKENVGRRTTLEVHDPVWGLHECGRDFPLRGVDFDPKANRLEIMLGRSGTVEGHLTHAIPGPEEIEVETNEEGLATALRVRLTKGLLILKINRE